MRRGKISNISEAIPARNWPTYVHRQHRNKLRTGGIRLPRGYHLWLALFLGATFLFQLLLIPSTLNSIRTPFRIALYASSLGMLLLVPGRIRASFVTGFATIITLLFCLQLFNPSNNSFVAAIAAIGLNFAILSPAFWCSRLKLRPENIQFLFLVLWGFHALSACFGVLEVYYPGTFGRESKIATDLLGDIAEGLKVTLANGESVYRPMGFSDTPGGAAASGYITTLLATGLLMQRSGIGLRLMLLASIIAGLFCIYLSQVRSLLVLTAICEFVILGTLIVRGQLFRVTWLLIAIPGIFAVATVWAFVFGGESVANRVSTLSEASAATVYYNNRGTFLEASIYRDLPEYPLGAGLGRWGMVYQYFGDKSSAAPPSVWAEIQVTAWIFDGGAMLLLVYYGALIAFTVQAFRVAFSRSGLMADFATIVLSLNVATLANTFSYVPFIGQSGLMFWLVNACFFATDFHSSRKPSAPLNHPTPHSKSSFTSVPLA